MLRWLLQRGVSVIPKTVKKERMRENLDVFDFALSDEDLRAIAALDTGKSTILDDQDLETDNVVLSPMIYKRRAIICRILQ